MTLDVTPDVTLDQALLFALLAGMVAAFASGRVRHDMVALGALLGGVALGLVPAREAFEGFGHPAVITVACVLILSRALQTSGAVDRLAARVLPETTNPTLAVLALAGLGGALSGVMNNVGALALLMPLALKTAEKTGLPPGRLLMPLAFGTILGGMTTLIGTPPNLIVSGFRRDALGADFAMLDFLPVGGAVALAGLAFTALVGWRLVPRRRPAGAEGFDAGAYLVETRAGAGSKAAGMSVAEAEAVLDVAGAQITALIRRDVRLEAPGGRVRLRAGDVLVLEVEPEALAEALSALDLELAEAEPPEAGEAAAEPREAADASELPATGAAAEAAAEAAAALPGAAAAVEAATGDGDGDEEDEEEDEEERRRRRAPEPSILGEYVVAVGSPLVGRTARGVSLRTRYRVNLLALSREGGRRVARLAATPLRAGDVVLLQGTEEALHAFASEMRCLPLAARELSLPRRGRMALAAAALLGAVALASSGLAPPPVAFAGGVLAAAATGVAPVRTLYDAVDWPVVVLLACLLPVAGAMEATGAAALLAGGLMGALGEGSALLALAVVLVLTMTLSDVMNNAATVAVMAPVAVTAAEAAGSPPDSFLMAVAIGGSCAFLTPVGHQNNTLILGPGGFRFGDYWRLGLPVEALVVAVAVPMLALVWGV